MEKGGGGWQAGKIYIVTCSKNRQLLLAEFPRGVLLMTKDSIRCRRSLFMRLHQLNQ